MEALERVGLKEYVSYIAGRAYPEWWKGLIQLGCSPTHPGTMPPSRKNLPLIILNDHFFQG